jgi:hypothetical protein
MRHLCLTDLARMGWELHTIATFAGHRSVDTTMAYIHLSGRDLAAKLNAGMAQIHAWRIATLRGHVDVCDLEPGHNRKTFPAWTDALPETEYVDPVPALDDSGVTRLRANRRVSGVPVVLTAAVHPF